MYFAVFRCARGFCDFYSVFDDFYSFLRGGGRAARCRFLDFYARAGNHGEL